LHLTKHHSIGTKAYDQIVESLVVTFLKARHVRLLQALTIESFHDVENFLVFLHSGQITYMQKGKQHTIEAGDILFIPGGQPLTITYGVGNPIILNTNYFPSKRQQYCQTIQAPDCKAQFETFSYITFDAKILNTANFFAYLGIPAFFIKNNAPLSATFKSMLLESSAEAVGGTRMLNAYTEQLVIELFRHLIAQNLFTTKLAAYGSYCKDPRLISIFHYVQDNLHGDLSNRILATVAHLAEDYAGQYFKMRTGVNTQDYIEYQRMEQAVKLLRSTQKSICSIAKAVGFRDTAYFCRRFKMKFGIPAGKMRSWGAVMGG
jgi:AraC-like DNA-binding protein